MTQPRAPLHPGMTMLTDARDAAGPPGDTPEAYRAFWARYSRATSRPCPDHVRTEDATVDAGHRAVPVRVYRPAGADGSGAGILYMHGGGFMLGDLDSSDTIAWSLADATGAVVISIDYRLAPEHPYPAAFDDCYGVLARLSDDAAAYGLEAGRLAVCGDSAGGCLAAALSLAARDRGGPAIAAQALIYPVTGPYLDLPSYAENADGPGLTTKSMRLFLDSYLPGATDTDDPYARPVAATDCSGLPPAWVHTAELDPIRDDGRVYAAMLARAGTDVAYREARGMIHGFLRARFAHADVEREHRLLCSFLCQNLGLPAGDPI